MQHCASGRVLAERAVAIALQSQSAGYEPDPRQLDAMLDGAAAQQAQGSLSLDWLLHEIEALIPAQQPPAHKAEAHQEELPPPVPHS